MMKEKNTYKYFKKKKNFILQLKELNFVKNQDLEKIENLWLIKKALPNCLKN